jgi:hypothetical protein
MVLAISRPRETAQARQLRSTEPRDEMRMPSISKRTPLQRMVTGAAEFGVWAEVDCVEEEEEAVITLLYG